MAEATEKYESIKVEYDQIAEELTALETAIEEERSYLSNTGVMREKLEGQINLFNEQIHALEGNQEHFRGRKKEEDIDYKERYEILKKYQAFLKAQREKK